MWADHQLPTVSPPSNPSCAPTTSPAGPGPPAPPALATRPPAPRPCPRDPSDLSQASLRPCEARCRACAQGVRPLINCRGTFTAMSGSLTLPEVKAAMDAAGLQYVDIAELQEAVGSRIGALMGTEYGVVTNGCASALAHITAGCIAGTDPAKQARLPFTDGMSNEIIVQKSHRVGYDYAIKATGGVFVEVETLDEMKAAFSDKTAMMFFLGDSDGREAQVSAAQMAALANEHGVTMVVDNAAGRPDVPNPFLEQGADVVCYSVRPRTTTPSAATTRLRARLAGWESAPRPTVQRSHDWQACAAQRCTGQCLAQWRDRPANEGRQGGADGIARRGMSGLFALHWNGRIATHGKRPWSAG